jgi:hypothetical protein
MKALAANSMEQVSKALREDPEAATMPFFDHRFQEPVAYAMSCGCSNEITQILLDRGATPADADLAAEQKAPAGLMAGRLALEVDIANNFVETLWDLEAIPAPPPPMLDEEKLSQLEFWDHQWPE